MSQDEEPLEETGRHVASIVKAAGVGMVELGHARAQRQAHVDGQRAAELRTDADQARAQLAAERAAAALGREGVARTGRRARAQSFGQPRGSPRRRAGLARRRRRPQWELTPVGRSSPNYLPLIACPEKKATMRAMVPPEWSLPLPRGTPKRAKERSLHDPRLV